MVAPVRILGIAGSLRKQSCNHAAQRFDEQGNLTDDAAKKRIGRPPQGLATLTRQPKAGAAA